MAKRGGRGAGGSRKGSAVSEPGNSTPGVTGPAHGLLTSGLSQAQGTKDVGPSNGRRFVVISDLHAHPWAAFAKGDGAQNDRLVRTLEVLDASLAYAQKLGIPWVFCGDLVHTAGYSLNVVLARLVQVFNRYPDLYKIVVAGNHDGRGVGGEVLLEQTVWGTLTKAVHLLIILEPAAQPFVTNGLSFAGAGAQPKKVAQPYAMSSDVGVYHGTVKGSIGPSGFVFEGSIEPDKLLRRHRISVVGDIHHPQQISAPQGQAILIPGSPEHHNFGDAGEHGWWVVTVPEDPTEDPSVEFHGGGSPEFRTVESLGDVLIDKDRVARHYYRVRNFTSTGRHLDEDLPENVIAMNPTRSAVASRETLRGLHTPAQILDRWLKEDPPPGDHMVYLPAGLALLQAHEATQLQPLRLERMTLSNFCSYESQAFAVRAGTWLVVGKGKDFPSNGAGKSSLFEALYWLLFGRTTKGLSGDEVIRWGADECVVAGEFTCQDGRILSARRYKTKTTSRLEVNEQGPDGIDGWGEVEWEATSVTEMTEKLTQRLGITPALYQALGYFSQEKLLLFASATDGERKEMLADLIGLSAYQEAATTASRQRDRLTTDLLVAEERLAGLNRQVVNGEERLLEARGRAAEWAVARDGRVATAQAEIYRFERERPTMRVLKFEAASAEVVTILARREQTLQVRRGELGRLLLAATADQTSGCSQEELDRRRGALERAKQAYAAANASVRTLENTTVTVRLQVDNATRLLAAGKCPTCLQQVTQEHRAQCLLPLEAQVSDLERQAAVLRAQADEALGEAATLTRQVESGARDVARDQQTVLWEGERLTIIRNLQALEQERTQLLEQAGRRLDKEFDTALAALQRALNQWVAEKNPHAAEEASRALALAQATSDRMLVSAEIEAKQREQGIFEYWAKGFSKQGLQSLLVEEVAILFNQTRGDIFPALTQGVYDVQFSTISRTKAGEAREKTEFLVFEHGEPIPYEALSGGQRRRIDVGVMLGLVKAVSVWMQVPGVLGILVLDEVFGFLDSSGAEGLMEALRIIQETIPSVYVVTHDAGLQALFSGTIMVEQGQDGVSRIVEG